MEETNARDECDIAAVGVVRGTLEEIARWRKCPESRPSRPLDLQCLRHADEHTVIGVAAVLAGLGPFPQDASFEGWGVVAAPRWPGRIGTTAALDKFKNDGPRHVSAMLIPNLCLHSMSGTLSLAFQMRGPNFGVGGGLACVADGLFTGLVVQLEHHLPGTWVVLSEWDVEPLGPAAQSQVPLACALAVALVPQGSAASLGRLRLQSAHESRENLAPPRLAQLADFLTRTAPMAQDWSCPLGGDMELVLQRKETSWCRLPAGHSRAA